MDIWPTFGARYRAVTCVLYAACAWGFLQGLEYVSESFNWPQEVRHIALLALARTDGRRQTGKQDQRQSDCESNCTDSPKLLLADPTVRIGS